MKSFCGQLKRGRSLSWFQLNLKMILMKERRSDPNPAAWYLWQYLHLLSDCPHVQLPCQVKVILHTLHMKLLMVYTTALSPFVYWTCPDRRYFHPSFIPPSCHSSSLKFITGLIFCHGDSCLLWLCRWMLSFGETPDHSSRPLYSSLEAPFIEFSHLWWWFGTLWSFVL